MSSHWSCQTFRCLGALPRHRDVVLRLLNEWSARTQGRTLLDQMPAGGRQSLLGDVGPVQIDGVEDEGLEVVRVMPVPGVDHQGHR